MNRAQSKLLAAVLSVFAALAAPGCGGSNSPPQDPTGASSKPQPGAAANGDPATGASDFSTAPSSAAPLGAGEGMAGPAQAPGVTPGTGSGDTPINSGAGDAAPVHAH